METKTMSRSVKRGVSSLSFSMNRLYRAITTAKPSSFVVGVLAISVAVFFFGGGLYDLIMKPLPAVYYGGRFLFLYPQLTEQFISDSIVAMTIYALGIIGMIAVYQSTKYVYKPRQAYMMLIIGFALVFMAYIFLEETIRIKLGR
jgi:hypothetical protein